MPKTRLVLIVAFVVVLVLMAVVPAAAAPLDNGYGPSHGSSSYGSNSYGHQMYGPAYYGKSSNNYQKSNYGQSACWYRVHWGDTLSKIAWHYGTSNHYLAWLNHLQNPDRIYAGQWLKVPCHY